MFKIVAGKSPLFSQFALLGRPAAAKLYKLMWVNDLFWDLVHWVFPAVIPAVSILRHHFSYAALRKCFPYKIVVTWADGFLP